MRSTAPATLEFTEEHWNDESYALVAERANPRCCPRCGSTGFYGPRALGRKSRACRFCGFYQEVGARPVRLKPVVHGCKPWPECAKAPYVWWVHPKEQWYDCPFCGLRVPVTGNNGFMKGTLVTAPSDDPAHPWWRVPQDRDYAYYLRFWHNWKCTKGRVVM